MHRDFNVRSPYLFNMVSVMITQMTLQKLLEEYGDVEVTFSHYYKYTFHFSGKTDGGRVVNVSIGGGSEDIYRMEVCNNETVKLAKIYGIHSVEVYDENGNCVAEYNDHW